MSKKYAYWFACAPGIGDKTMRRLLNLCPDERELYFAGEKLWQQVLNNRQMEQITAFARKADPGTLYEELVKTGIQFLTIRDPSYPDRLLHIPDPPYALFVAGKLPREDRLSVAVVGARDCSSYGSYVASGIGAALGQHGVQVISGMARGIDGISQNAALDAGGSSFGVLGCGVDVCYPESNRPLYERLHAQGGILSAYPPKTPAKPNNFPPRNRIVSGLADALIVVEARSKSGTLITVDMALEQGKEVYVVPGRVTDRLSDGCNWLLKQGAAVFVSPEDFLQEIGVKCGPHAVREMEVAAPDSLRLMEPQLKEIYEVLTLEPQSVEQIGEKLAEKNNLKDLTVLLMRLCLEKLAVQVSPGQFRLVAI